VANNNNNNIYKYKNECLSTRPQYASLNGWTDFDGICCVFEWFPRDDLDLQLVNSTRGGAQTSILSFTMETFFL